MFDKAKRAICRKLCACRTGYGVLECDLYHSFFDIEQGASCMLIEQLEQVKRERDALKDDLTRMATGKSDFCNICNDYKNAIGGVCRGMGEFSENLKCFEWRGVQAPEE